MTVSTEQFVIIIGIGILSYIIGALVMQYVRHRRKKDK